tara:strand:+ start:8135 stop:10069 length:1935 start_codon:yes stop_codon:yes gene_type:complete
MSMNLQNSVGAASRNGPAPGLGLVTGATETPSSSGEGRDFAAVMRDVLQPEARQAPGRRRQSEVDSASDAKEASALGRAERKKQRSADVDSSAPSRGEANTVAAGARSHKIQEKEEKKPARSKGDDDSVGADPVADDAAVAVPIVASPIVTPAAVVASATVEPDKSNSESKPGNAGTVIAPAASAKPNSVPLADVAVVSPKIVSEPTPARVEDADNASNVVPAEKQVRPDAQAGPKDTPPDIGKKPAEASQIAVQADKAAPPKAGEATALLSIVKEKITALIGRSADRKDAATSAAPTPRMDGDAAPAAAKPAAKDATPPQGKIVAGLQVAAEHAAPGSAVVARMAALQAPQTPTSASARGVEGPQVSALAIAAAQTAEASSHGAKGEGDTKRDTSVPLGSGLSSDAAAPKDAAPDQGFATTHVAPRTDVAGPGIPAGTPPLSGAAPTAGTVNLAGALGQQVVDLGVSGQWIDDIAREIANVGANPGHGSFRIASQALGAVRVDITPGAQGSDILMTVDTEAAQSALMNDRQRLVQDAQLASVRIGEVRVDRVASLGQAQSGDMSQGNQGQGGNAQPGAQGALSQNGAQNNGQNARGDMGNLAGQGQNSSNPKTSFTRTVLGEANSGDMPTRPAGQRGDMARYA